MQPIDPEKCIARTEGPSVYTGSPVYTYGFVCIVCGRTEELPYIQSPFTPICKECLNDLKEIITERREIKKEV